MRRCVSASLRRVASKPVFSARAPDFHIDADARKYPASSVNFHETEATSVDVRPELRRRPRFSCAVHFFRMDRHAQGCARVRALAQWTRPRSLAGDDLEAGFRRLSLQMRL